MGKKLGRSLFGFKPGDVISEIENINSSYQGKIDILQGEIARAREELEKSEKKIEQLQGQLNSYMEKEKMVTEVMVAAQQSAQKTEEQARERARAILEKSEAELKQKLQELEFLRMKVARFKEDFRDMLDNYRVSLETIKEEPEETAFVPTVITNEKLTETDKKKDASF
jgi:chromosome segregation ATPase